MFEKEAEEVLNKHYCCKLLSECLEGIRTRCSAYEEHKNLLLKGIEVGYNKAKEEIESLKKNNAEIADQWCKEQQNVYDLEQKILCKANEWHYVKDGKYPTDEKDVEVLYQDCDKINVYNCIYDIHAENWLYYNLDNMMLELFPYNVIAWKEIVLPKEEE